MTQTSIDFNISPYNSNVIYIYSSLFTTMPNTVSKVRQMHKDYCKMDVVLCQQNPCNSTLAIYLDGIGSGPVTPRDIETKLYQNIRAFLTIEINPDHAEIYNVCTDERYRGQGIMTKILESVLFDIPLNRVWVGIDMNNPIRDDVFRLYSYVGFDFVGIQKITPSGNFPSFPFLAMEYIKGKSLPKNQYTVDIILSNTQKIINDYMNSIIATGNYERGGLCKIRTYIRGDLIYNIKEHYINKNVEYGGLMGIKNIGGNLYLLGLGAITKGTVVKGAFTVNLPNYYINWHTHPSICYTENKCYIGWPSGQDMSILISQYPQGLLAHVLFSIEGIYFLQLSPEMMLLLQVLDTACVSYLADLIRYFFTDLEDFRKAKYDPERIKCLEERNDIDCLTYDSRQKHMSLQTIINIIQTTTLSFLLNSRVDPKVQNVIDRSGECARVGMARLKEKDLNINIFRVQYTSMEDAITNGGIYTDIEYYMAPVESTCSPPDYEGMVEFSETHNI